MKNKILNPYVVFPVVLILSLVPTYIVHTIYGFQIALYVLISVSLSFLISVLVRLEDILVVNSNFDKSVDILQQAVDSNQNNNI